MAQNGVIGSVKDFLNTGNYYLPRWIRRICFVLCIVCAVGGAYVVFSSNKLENDIQKNGIRTIGLVLSKGEVGGRSETYFLHVKFCPTYSPFSAGSVLEDDVIVSQYRWDETSVGDRLNLVYSARHRHP